LKELSQSERGERGRLLEILDQSTARKTRRKGGARERGRLKRSRPHFCSGRNEENKYECICPICGQRQKRVEEN